MKSRQVEAKEAKQEIADAAKRAEALRALQTEDALKVIAAAAAEAMKTTHAQNNIDHDLIVEMKTEQKIKFEQVFRQLDEMKDLTTKRIDALERLKLDRDESYAVLYKADIDKALADQRLENAKVSTSITQIRTVGSVLLFILGSAQIIIGIVARFAPK